MVFMEDGIVICDRCQGSSIIIDEFHIGNICPKCHGTGKLNWIENIFGKEHPSISIAKDLVNVQPMSEPTGQIFCIKPVIKK